MKSHLKFNKQERSGIFFLLLIIILLQGIYFYVKNSPSNNEGIVEVNEQLQQKINSLKKVASKKDSIITYPFNPNFITDYKGYTLGMSVDEIDRLHVFRIENKFVNSAEEFQEVTAVSDSLLNAISPYFKFPEWVSNRKQLPVKSSFKKPEIEKEKTIADINIVTAETLKEISGIGEKLSARIIKFRDRLGGFLINEQLYDVYGLEPVVVERALERFQVLHPPEIKKVNINKASASEISQLIYIRYNVAVEIVSYRENKGKINSFEELINIEGFPTDKINRIQLYLSLD